MKRILITLLWVITMLSSSVQFASAGLQLSCFESDGYQKILDLHQGDAFLMVLWSLDCPPCIDELSTLGEFHRRFPEAKIVLVSTDAKTQEEEISQLMKSHGLDDIQQWVFDGNSIQAIRHAIDPLWYGELPRSYFHQENHQRRAMSGRLNDDVLLAWFNATENRIKGI